jgi:hypothetical protein
MKDDILKLKSEGKTYREIQEILGCSRGLISYYVNPMGKSKTLNRQNRNRFRRRTKFKMLAGGKCEICQYDKCIDALQFHHKNPKEKLFEISAAIWGKHGVSDNDILEEMKKCSLMCANCHAEKHSVNYFD